LPQKKFPFTWMFFEINNLAFRTWSTFK
jgi:hypothetical protein